MEKCARRTEKTNIQKLVGTKEKTTVVKRIIGLEKTEKTE